MATITTATIGSADKFTISQPAAMTIRPEENDASAIIAKIRKSFAPCALAFSSGR